MGHRKKRMQDMVTQVNNNSNGRGNVLSPATYASDPPLEQKSKAKNPTRKDKKRHQKTKYKGHYGKFRRYKHCVGDNCSAPSENENPITQQQGGGEHSGPITSYRKKSEAKKEGEHGPKHVRNPDKIVYDSRNFTKVRKEDFVRSGDRKKRNLKEIKLAAIAAAGMTGLSRLGNKK